MKIFKIIALLLIVLFLLLEIFVFNTDEKKSLSKPIVSVSTFTLYDITKHIAGESVELVNILPFGVDPHSFELTPMIMAKIEKSSVVFYSGAGLEPWIDKIHFKTKSIDMSKHVSLHDLDHDAHEGHYGEHCSHSGVDPHYWLDFENMISLVKKITSELQTVVPRNSKLYEKNSHKYIAMLKKLDEKYTKELHSCKKNNVIINHNSLGYLANKYSFEAESLNGLSPEAEPSPSDIKRILDEIKSDKISTIFYENFINAKVMKSISKDADVNAEVFSPLGNITADEAALKATYESLMLVNLEKLRKAMMCR